MHPGAAVSPPLPTLPAGSVVALAGRRPDALDTERPRFPASELPRVRRELAVLLHPGVRALVCSAACGADLLALEAAGAAGIERHVVLPFDARTFRTTSVVDRPGDWGPLFDRLMAEVGRSGRLEVGTGDPDDPRAYIRANERIVQRAAGLAGAGGVRRQRAAVVVWEGDSRGEGDATEDFLRRAGAAGFMLTVVRTVSC